MQIQSAKGYDSPKIASFYTVNVPNSNPFEISVSDSGAITLALGSDPYEVDLRDLLQNFPVIRKRNYWVLERRWACVFYPEWDTSIYLNQAGKQFCLLCNGKNTFHDILEKMVKANSKYDRKTVTDDMIRFLYLLKRLKLVTIKRGNKI